MIRLRSIVKVYRAGDVLVPALQGIDLDIERGEFLAIVGAIRVGQVDAHAHPGLPRQANARHVRAGGPRRAPDE